MIIFLRFIRALFGIVFYWQIITLIIGLITHLESIQTILQDSKIVTLLMIKMAILLISGFITYLMGNKINKIYQQKYDDTNHNIRSLWRL